MKKKEKKVTAIVGLFAKSDSPTKSDPNSKIRLNQKLPEKPINHFLFFKTTCCGTQGATASILRPLKKSFRSDIEIYSNCTLYFNFLLREIRQLERYRSCFLKKRLKNYTTLLTILNLILQQNFPGCLWCDKVAFLPKKSLSSLSA